MRAARALPGTPAVLWLLSFLFAPLALVVLTSVSPTNVLPGGRAGGPVDASAATAPFPFTLHHFERALSEPFVSVLWSSLTLSAGATLLCLVAAFPVAWFLARRPAATRGLWLALFLTPFLLNFLVRVYAWFILLRPEGLLSRLATAVGYDGALTSSRATVVLGLVYGYLPFFLLPLYAVLERLDARQIEAARDLGAGAWSQFRHVVLPHARPGILAGLVLVFVPMMGEYCVPRMLGGGLIPTLGTQIETQFIGGVRPNWPFGSALSVMLMVLSTAAIVVGVRFGARLLESEGEGA